MDKLPGAVKRSGGPKTKEGKANSSRNALGSGAYARVSILKDERAKDLAQLRQVMIDELKPETLLQSLLVDDIVISIWRKLRLERYESKVQKILESGTIKHDEWFRELGIAYEHVISQSLRLDHHAAKKGVGYYKMLLEKIAIVKDLYPRNCPDLERFKIEHKEVYELSRALALWPNKLDEALRANEPVMPEGGFWAVGFWAENLKKIEKYVKDWVDVFKSSDLVATAIPRIMNKRLYQHLVSGESDRASDDISRAIHRSLSEFYRERDRHRRDKSLLIQEGQT